MKSPLPGFTLQHWLVGLLLLTLSASTGCKRKRPEQPPATGSSAQTAAGSSVARTVEELNYALQDHRERTGKMPTSLAELVTASKLSLPQLPPGGHLELDQRLKTVKYVGPGGK